MQRVTHQCVVKYLNLLKAILCSTEGTLLQDFLIIVVDHEQMPKLNNFDKIAS